uniref:DUF4351 domain-containing protein n=1 Tax=Candidatus Kentrum sp. FW TaxID=2126338 RepID=A0A450SYL7_9GAMM|nr:MAG: protein of unknown function (DUF4351) [Candidatus Kentron sp. FW]
MEEAEKVLTQIDMTRIPAYRLGMEKGELAFLTRQLSHKFGPLPPKIEKRINNARSKELAMWGERILAAKSLDEVFL